MDYSSLINYLTCLIIFSLSVLAEEPRINPKENGGRSNIQNVFSSPLNTMTSPIKSSGSCNCTCGVKNDETRIVGGQPTEWNELPWMARLSYLQEFYCGGSLINDLHVLTAAHCVKGFIWFMIEVTLGEHNRCINEARHVTRYVVKAFTGNFSSKSLDNDIALLKLNERVLFSDAIRPICLPIRKGKWTLPFSEVTICSIFNTRNLNNKTDNDYNDVKALVSGWGTLKEEGSPSCVLQKVEVPVISLQDCRKMNYTPEMITDNMLCAGYVQGQKDSCQGDSGGPLIVERRDERYEIIGVVSWGNGCARPGYPGVYTRITQYLDWILMNSGDGCFCES